MKPTMAFTITLFASLLFGAGIFFSLVYLANGSVGSTIEPFEVLYGIYIGIQFILSMINHVQVSEMAPDQNELQSNYKKQVLNRLLKAELILYCIVFTVLLVIISCIFFLLQDGSTTMDKAYGLLVIISIIFCFSVPYILCCTASVILFYALITGGNSQPDTGGAKAEDQVEAEPISDRWPAP